MKKGRPAGRTVFALVLGTLATLVALPLPAQNACWPEGAQPSPAPVGTTGTSAPTGPTSVYFDGSGSMAGYARLPTTGADAESLYRALVLLLPQTLAAAGEQVEFLEFGKKSANSTTEFPKIPDQKLQELTKPTYYCPTNVCRYQDSPIADAFKRILEQPPNSLGMVITDLFLSNSELVGIGGRELQLPLSKALREGRAIGVLALKAASSGPIYDLSQLNQNQCYSREKGLEICNRNAPQYMGATSRPLFVIMIGPADRILRFKQRLDSDLLKQVRADHQRFTVFTREGRRNYLSPDRWPKNTFPIPAKGRQGEFLNSHFPAGFPGQQIVVPSRGTEGITGEIDLTSSWTPGVPPPVSVTLEAKSWIQQRGVRCDQMWHAQSDAASLRIVDFEYRGSLKGRMRIAHPSPRDAGMLPNFESYLIAGKFTATGLQLDRWFDEWGYNEADEMRVLDRRPAFFPAKNLPRLGKVLVDIVQEKPELVPLGEFRLGIALR